MALCPFISVLLPAEVYSRTPAARPPPRRSASASERWFRLTLLRTA